MDWKYDEDELSIKKDTDIFREQDSWDFEIVQGTWLEVMLLMGWSILSFPYSHIPQNWINRNGGNNSRRDWKFKKETDYSCW